MILLQVNFGINTMYIQIKVKNFLKYIEILFSGILGSLCFFIITNFGAWLTLEMYEKNAAGLLQSYIMAIPFFHNTLISTFLYLIIFKLFFDFVIERKKLKTSF